MNAQVETAKTTRPAKSAKGGNGTKPAQVASVQLRDPIPSDEPAKRGLVVNEADKTATATFSLKFAKGDADRYQYETKFDLSGLTYAELAELALRSVVIDVQARLRAMGKDAARKRGVMATVNVKTDIVDAQRATGDDTTRLIRNLMRVLGVDEAAARKIVESNLKADASE